MVKSGPGRLITWEETLTDVEREELEKCKAEAAETMKNLRAMGLLPDQPLDTLTPDVGYLAQALGKPSGGLHGHRLGDRMGGVNE